MALQTNVHAEQRQQNKRPDKTWKETIAVEMKLFIFIQFMFGIQRMPETAMCWSSDPLLQISAIADVMSKGRFQKLCQYFHLNEIRLLSPKGNLNMTLCSKSALCLMPSLSTAAPTTFLAGIFPSMRRWSSSMVISASSSTSKVWEKWWFCGENSIDWGGGVGGGWGEINAQVGRCGFCYYCFIAVPTCMWTIRLLRACVFIN